MGERDKFINNLIKFKNDHGLKIAMDHVIALREEKDNIKYLKEIMKDQSFTDFINANDAIDIERAIAILNGKKNLKGGVKKKKGAKNKKSSKKKNSHKKTKNPTKESRNFFPL